MAVQAQRFLTSRARWIVFVLLVVSAAYLLAVTPVRTYLDQRRQMHVAEQRYEVLTKANERLTQRTTELQSDAEIARLAREQYELVPQGAQAYAVMPPGSAAVPAPSQNEHHQGLWSRIWDDVTFWD